MTKSTTKPAAKTAGRGAHGVTKSISLNSMNKRQLEKLVKDVQKALKALEKREQHKAREKAKAAAEKVAAKHGFKLSDLIGGPAKSAKSPTRKVKAGAKKTSGEPKYVNPHNSAETWTGKGRRPKWYRDAIASGTAAHEMEIKQAS